MSANKAESMPRGLFRQPESLPERSVIASQFSKFAEMQGATAGKFRNSAEKEAYPAASATPTPHFLSKLANNRTFHASFLSEFA
ncbi:MAG TPA: hypothetical protein VF618_00350 [Thermoanaerobaculia bacterium]